MQKKFSISVKSAFKASHWHDKTLNEAAHTHHFKYRVTLEGPLNEEGYLVDFRRLEAALKTLSAKLEGKDLNTIFKHPTAEKLAEYLFDAAAEQFKEVKEVALQETEDYYAVCRAD
ncbi:MAG: 6-carboxytetrahydropterin synthase [Elusimicrobiota bacterium]|jgi:6-pyruvoyl-tetrahydropterin synthase|nr:6-carboxytetrahydropterin synthase [Elusimicrobiota bacterium]